MYPDSPSRSKLDLSGRWQYSLDGKTWNAVNVPSAYDFTGKVTFSRTFDVKPELLDSSTFTLVCYGINYSAEITINGNFVGRHQGGYSSFAVSIPANTLQMGSQNSIKISVDNELTPATTLPPRQQAGGWRTYGGIFRDMYILATPKLYIEDVAVPSDFTPEGKTSKISVKAEIIDRGSGIKTEPGNLLGFQVEAFDKLSGEAAGRSGITPIRLESNKSESVSAEVVLAQPKLWYPSPDTSSLYVFKCQIVKLVNKEVSVLDEYNLDVGLREIRWRDGRLFVNGRSTMLKGLLWQEEHASFASAMTYEAMERDVAMMKTLGANLVRFQYPPHPYLLNLCDRYGLLVIEEVPLTAVPADFLAKDYYQELASTYVKEMIGRDKNHSSVLAWGIGDGFETGTPGAWDFVKDSRSLIASLDRRPVYYCTNRLNDSCTANVDILALNYDGTDPKDLKEVLKQGRTTDKPIIITRYGREVEPKNHNGYSDPLSMESQARTAMLLFDAIRDSRIAGGVLASFNDWRTDRPSLATHSKDPYLRAMGIVSGDREKRIAFDVVRAMFNGEKVQALPIGTYSSSAPIIYVLAGLVVLIAFAFMYNGNRRFRDAVNRSMFRLYNFFADVRDQRIIPYSHSIFLAMIISLTLAALLSSVFTFYRNNLLLDNLLSQVMSDSVKERFIQLVWNPSKFILAMSGLLFAAFCLLSVVVRLLSMTVRTHVYFYHSFAITMWSLLPYIIFIPLVMVFYRLLESQLYIVPIFSVVGIVTLWVLLRLLKGISIIYDVYPFKVYAIGLLMLVVIGVALYGYADYSESASAYVRYMMHSSKNL